MLGVDKPGSKVSINSSDILFQGKSLMGSIFGGLKPKTDVPILFKRYMDKVLCSMTLFW
jgi:S-(hydroxymethyl)glutathione dehydrogenase/alcohol dehydrogenase